MSLSVAAPGSLTQLIHVPLKTMTGPGPSNVCDRVLQVTIKGERSEYDTI